MMSTCTAESIWKLLLLIQTWCRAGWGVWKWRRRRKKLINIFHTCSRAQEGEETAVRYLLSAPPQAPWSDGKGEISGVWPELVACLLCYTRTRHLNHILHESKTQNNFFSWWKTHSKSGQMISDSSAPVKYYGSQTPGPPTRKTRCCLSVKEQKWNLN